MNTTSVIENFEEVLVELDELKKGWVHKAFFALACVNLVILFYFVPLLVILVAAVASAIYGAILGLQEANTILERLVDLRWYAPLGIASIAIIAFYAPLWAVALQICSTLYGASQVKKVHKLLNSISF